VCSLSECSSSVQMFAKIEFECDVSFSDIIAAVKLESEFLDEYSSFDEGLNANNLHVVVLFSNSAL